MAGDLPAANSVDDVFEAAVDIVQGMPKKGPIRISVSQKLRLYSLFKQGTVGKCNIRCPPFWCAVDRLKWHAWNSVGTLESIAAKQMYIEELKSIINRVHCDYDIAELARSSDERTKQLLKIKLSMLGYDLSDLKTEADLKDLRKQSNGAVSEKSGTTGQTGSGAADFEEDECSVSSSGSDDEYMDVADCNDGLHNCWQQNSDAQSNDRVAAQSPVLSISEAKCMNVSAVIQRRLEILLSLLTYIRRVFAILLSRWDGTLAQLKSRWKLISFMIIWPFIATFITAYLCYIRLTRY